MDTTSPSAPQTLGSQRRPDLPISSGSKKAGKPRKPWPLTIGLLLLALVGSLVAISAVNRAGDRVSVLTVARDVKAGQPIRDADIAEAMVAEDPALDPIPREERASVVGKRAAVDLRKGGLVVRSQLQGGSALGDDLQIVGVEVKRGFAPRDEFQAGDKVLAVLLPAQGETSTGGAKEDSAQGAEGADIAATVKSMSRADATGAVVVNVAVDPADGPRLAQKAAAKQVALVREPRAER